MRFDCRLTNTTIRVKLSQRVRGGKFIERYPDGCRIDRTGQIFVIHSVNLNDVGIYYCEAPDAKIKKKPHSYLDVHPGKTLQYSDAIQLRVQNREWH